jgi:PX domain
LGYEVRRRDSDFAFLRKILVRQFPHLVVPPCSGTPPAKNIPKLIERREKYYARFMQAVMRSEEMKNSQFLLDFIYE